MSVRRITAWRNKVACNGCVIGGVVKKLICERLADKGE